MSVRVIDVADPTGWDTAIAQARQVIAAGHILVLPTDTVYGVGTDPFNAPAVASVLALKGRDGSSPSPVLVGDERDLEGLGIAPDPVSAALAQRYWPGALTLIVRTSSALARNLGSLSDTIAVRMPAHPFTLALLRATGPLAVTSANHTGETPATTWQMAHDALGEGVELYLDAGATPGPVASTIVDLSGSEPRVVRDGVVNGAEVLAHAARAKRQGATG